jgi:alkylated DNA repair dioxygenase AlkB
MSLEGETCNERIVDVARKRTWNVKEPRGKKTKVAVANGTGFIARKRTWDAKKLKWRNDWTTLVTKDSLPVGKIPLPLPSGGMFNIYPGLLSEERQQELAQELHDANLYRQYYIHATKEPRAHFLLHKRATTTDENFDTSLQPGYTYGRTTLKSRPLSLLPKLEELSDYLLDTCDVDEWNIGVNPVCYRDGKDHIGRHSDNNQGEDKVMTVILKSPGTPRIIVIEKKAGGEKGNGKKGVKLRQEGDEQYELNLGAGDAYDMDGEMQKHYVHSVTKRGKKTKEDPRVAVVLRHGTFALCNKDSGKSLKNTEPRKDIGQMFGRMDALLVEGDSYSRTELRDLGVHSSVQKGISGNQKTGCDAIILSGAREDGLGEDLFDRIMYAAESRVGAGALLISMENHIPIRVFRSSSGKNSTYKALPIKNSNQYRYDGLYEIIYLTFQDDTSTVTETPSCLSKKVLGRLYQFYLKRLPCSNPHGNTKTTQELMQYSCRECTIAKEAVAKFAEQNFLANPAE